MSDILEFKCPYCGGRMEFDSTLQKMKCPYCDSVMEVDAFDEEVQESEHVEVPEGAEALKGEDTPKAEGALEGDSEFENACSGGEWQESEINGMQVYSCQSCGGEIVAEETTGASSCPYCGNRIMIKSKFAGGLKPDLIIPFAHDKKSAKEKYCEHLKGKGFLPKVFKQENHIDEIKGVYVPFWVFDADVSANCDFNATNVVTWSDGDYNYTKTSTYKVKRGLKASFQGIPADASRKMDDTLMESIEPFDAKKAVPFKPAYLSGFMADRYDVEAPERFERARERIRASAVEACRSTVKNYTTVSAGSDNVQILHSEYRYALFPVWILNTTWRGNNYTFAMNGQTGRMTGDLPLDKTAWLRFVVIVGMIVAGILYGLAWAIMLA